MFVTSSSLSDLATSEPFVSLAPAAQTALFDDSEKNLFVGFESSEVQGSLLYFWHPHTATSGLRHSMAAMKDAKTVTLDSSMDMSGLFVSTASEWTLTQSSESHILSLTENGQLKIYTYSDSKLTLLSLHIVAKEVTADRTSPLIEVGSGSLRFSSCSIGESGGTIPLTLCSVEGGSVSFEGDTTIVNPSASDHLLRVMSGELSINSSLTITHSLSPRTWEEQPFSSSIQSHAFSSDLPTIVDQNGGSVTMLSCSFLDGSLTGSFIASCGSMKIVDTRFTELRAKSSSNGNEKRALTLTVNENERVVIGDENGAAEFLDCSSDGDGGAIHCSVHGGGKLNIAKASFSGCSSSGVRDWMHLTGWSFEHLIVVSNWEVSQSSLSSPSDDSLLFGVDLAKNRHHHSETSLSFTSFSAKLLELQILLFLLVSMAKIMSGVETQRRHSAEQSSGV
ncbi:hypothetical protein BLNAU_24251 [Blattamonas nauphoetae]|uniref:Uncharacterized protein n=1 Tax=Blattamonas nauphoetae TaxID=2049346 RepID=A0ABQ9WNE4_9EUKA|nr:hypothetical protein BLNAU_24251 [Blattamonas nauphoetae]